jgi:hypothetical protein
MLGSGELVVAGRPSTITVGLGCALAPPAGGRAGVAGSSALARSMVLAASSCASGTFPSTCPFASGAPV